MICIDDIVALIVKLGIIDTLGARAKGEDFVMLKPNPETSTEAERPVQLGIQSVEVAGEILQALLLADGPLKLVDLARAADMPSAKAHRYLVSLMRIGLANQDVVTGRYDLGPVAMQLGVKGFTRFEPLRFAEQSVRELVDQVGETAGITAWSERGPIFVRLIEARHDLATSIGPLHACPLTYSATGLLFCGSKTRREQTRRSNVSWIRTAAQVALACHIAARNSPKFFCVCGDKASRRLSTAAVTATAPCVHRSSTSPGVSPWRSRSSGAPAASMPAQTAPWRALS